MDMAQYTHMHYSTKCTSTLGYVLFGGCHDLAPQCEFQHCLSVVSDHYPIVASCLLLKNPRNNNKPNSGLELATFIALRCEIALLVSWRSTPKIALVMKPWRTCQSQCKERAKSVRSLKTNPLQNIGQQFQIKSAISGRLYVLQLGRRRNTLPSKP